MKLHFLFDFKEGPWGGGNQFLKALRDQFHEKGIYSESAEEADVILINGHQYGKNNLHFLKLWKLFRSRPDIVVLHRVDGPISIVRGNDSNIDKLIYYVNGMLAHGTIFQSGWSKDQNLLLGMQENKISTIIMNSPDPKIFHNNKKQHASPKTKIIATSWSPNPRKGFDIYKYLDQHLDWDRYEMTFVGNCPGTFSKINYLPPVSSRELADLLRQHDIFLTASLNDPCSNSLIEALHCGLPSIALNSGGHPEIIRNAGELFEGKNDVLDVIDKVAADIEGYRSKIEMQSITDIGDAYYDFAKETASAKGGIRFSLPLLGKLLLTSFVRTRLH